MNQNQIVPITQSLIRLERLRQEIEAARSVPEVKDLRDRTEAFRRYLQQANESRDMLNAVAELKLRAERRIGQLLIEADLYHNRNKSDNWSYDTTIPESRSSFTLNDIGISKDQSSQWQKIAAIPDQAFEAFLTGTPKRGGELTTAGLLRLARQQPRPRPADPCEGWDWPEDSPYRLNCAHLEAGLAALSASTINCILTQPPPPSESLAPYETLARESARLLCHGGSLLLFARPGDVADLLPIFTPHLRYYWMITFLASERQFAHLAARKVENYWLSVLWFVRDGYLGGWVKDFFFSRFSDDLNDPDEEGFSRLVRNFTEPDDVILDPFLGVNDGAVARASLGLERRFIGLHPDPDFLEHLSARLDRI